MLSEESELTLKHSLHITFLYLCKNIKNTSLGIIKVHQVGSVLHYLELRVLPSGLVTGLFYVRARADTATVLIAPLQEGLLTLSIPPVCGPLAACQDLLGQSGPPGPSQACNCSHS